MNPYLAEALRQQQEKRRQLAADSAGYSALLIADLNAEIARRNEGREEADLLVPAGTKKADLIQALEADDNSNEES